MSTPAPLRVHRVVDTTIDKLCDEFERQLKGGHQASFDDYLSQVPEVDRQQAFRELLLVQLSYVAAHQHTDLIERYMGQYPQYADLLCRMWVGKPSEPTVTSRSEERIHCPHCRGPIMLLGNVTTSPAKAVPADATSPASASKTAVTTRFLHHYRLLNEIGQGSFGTVYRAFDTKLGRIVAIKIPRSRQFADSEEEIRFLREARSAGQLDHPAIVKVLDAGFCQDTHYIVSDFCPGRSLAERIVQQPLTVREAVTLVCQVADALEHAHTRQIIHRDLKTSNILVDDQGRPKLTDFGLARHDTAEISLTADGMVLGTPGYMSPEQAQGGAHYVDRRSDIYSLGVVLFELLTGERPFRGTSLGVLQQVIHDAPPAPSSLDPSIDRDLDTICLKCLQKLPQARYATAHALAQDLRLWLDGRPVEVRPAGRCKKLFRWCVGHKLVVAAVIGSVMFLLGAGGGLAWNAGKLRHTNRQLINAYIEALRDLPEGPTAEILKALAPHRAAVQPLLEEELRRAALSDQERARLRQLLASSEQSK